MPNFSLFFYYFFKLLLPCTESFFYCFEILAFSFMIFIIFKVPPFPFIVVVNVAVVTCLAVVHNIFRGGIDRSCMLGFNTHTHSHVCHK